MRFGSDSCCLGFWLSFRTKWQVQIFSLFIIRCPAPQLMCNTTNSWQVWILTGNSIGRGGNRDANFHSHSKERKRMKLRNFLKLKESKYLQGYLEFVLLSSKWGQRPFEPIKTQKQNQLTNIKNSKRHDMKESQEWWSAIL